MSNFGEFDVPEGKPVPNAANPTSGNPAKPEPQAREPKASAPSRSNSSPQGGKGFSLISPKFGFTVIGLAGLYVFAVGVLHQFTPDISLFFSSELEPYMYWGWIAAALGLTLAKGGFGLLPLLSRIAWFAFTIGSIAWAGFLVWNWIQTGEWWDLSVGK